jgi:hypothetical protein
VDPQFAEQMTKIVANVATVLVAIGALCWFIMSQRYRKRVEFDLAYTVFHSQNLSEPNILELKFILDNKGQVEHCCYAMAFEVVELRSDGTSAHQGEGFIFRSRNIVDERAIYYYVRPGVRQFITHTLAVPRDVRLAKVRAFFTYERRRMNVDPTKAIRDQYLARPDWTALARVVSLSGEGVTGPGLQT